MDTRRPDLEISRPLRELAGFALVGAGAFVLAALASFDPHDYAARAFPVSPEIHNLGGAPGRDAAGLLLDWVGIFPSFGVAASLVLTGLAVRRGGIGQAARARSAARAIAR